MLNAADSHFQIVIAWTTTEAEIAQVRRTDLGERPKMREVIVPHAAMWLNLGTAEDVAKAKAYAKAEGHTVFTYRGEDDPIACAKRDVAAMGGWCVGHLGAPSNTAEAHPHGGTCFNWRPGAFANPHAAGVR